jgi:hypothetical protein
MAGAFAVTHLQRACGFEGFAESTSDRTVSRPASRLSSVSGLPVQFLDWPLGMLMYPETLSLAILLTTSSRGVRVPMV